jgi:hypothetical protein
MLEKEKEKAKKNKIIFYDIINNISYELIE